MLFVSILDVNFSETPVPISRMNDLGGIWFLDFVLKGRVPWSKLSWASSSTMWVEVQRRAGLSLCTWSTMLCAPSLGATYLQRTAHLARWSKPWKSFRYEPFFFEDWIFSTYNNLFWNHDPQGLFTLGVVMVVDYFIWLGLPLKRHNKC